ncbi:MAG: hypothetical protein PVJ19_21560 [Desulfobacteraceae bacterium]|jgi:hypothetical protein
MDLKSSDSGAKKTFDLAGPDDLSCKATHWLGPFAALSGRAVALSPVRFTLQNRSREALSLRSVDVDPLQRQMDDALTTTLEVLSEARALGIEDSRLKRANRSLTRARELFKDLRSRVKEGRAGSTEVASLEKQYQDLKTRAAALDMLLPAVKAPSALDDAGLADLVRAFQQSQWHNNFDTLLLAIDQGFGPHVVRAHLALAAGEADRARRLAVTIRRWLRRTAHFLDQRATMMVAWRMWSDEMVARQQALARLLQHPDFPEKGRIEVHALMDKARTALSKDRSLQDFQNAYSALQRAETAALEWQSKQIVGDIRAGVAAVMAKTSTDKIEKAIAGLTPGDGPEERQQNILAILDLWQERVDACDAPERRDRMVKQVASLRSLARGNDKAALSAGFKALFDQWSAYIAKHAAGCRVFGNSH